MSSGNLTEVQLPPMSTHDMLVQGMIDDIETAMLGWRLVVPLHLLQELKSTIRRRGPAHFENIAMALTVFSRKTGVEPPKYFIRHGISGQRLFKYP